MKLKPKHYLNKPFHPISEPVASNASASVAVSMGEGQTSTRVPLFGGALVFGALGAAGLLLAAPALCWIILRALHATSKYQRANDCDSLADSDSMLYKPIFIYHNFLPKFLVKQE